jgi:hypothetical protein
MDTRISGRESIDMVTSALTYGPSAAMQEMQDVKNVLTQRLFTLFQCAQV